MILRSDYRKIMAKMLELGGLVLVVIMALSFVGVFQPTVGPGLSWLFWGCAGGALMIIMYRKMKRKQEEKQD